MKLSDVLEVNVQPEFADVFGTLVGSTNKKFKADDDEGADSVTFGSLLKSRASELEAFEEDVKESEDLKVNLPVIAVFGEDIALIHNSTSHFFKIIESKRPTEELSLSFEDLLEQATSFYKVVDSRTEKEYMFKPFGVWLSTALKRYKKYYRDVILASVVINIVALMIPLFSMNVYDKVVPNSAFQTLWVLASIILVGMCYDWVLKVARAQITDRVGKEIDEELSMKLMERVLRSRAEQKPASIGSYSKSFSDFDGVREFMMSATSTTLVDLPFSLLFLAVVMAIGGWIVLVPITAMIIMIGISVYSQRRLGEQVQKQFEVKARRSGTVFEALQMADLLKTSNAIPTMLQRWRSDIKDCSNVGYATSTLTTKITSSTQLVMQLVSIATVIAGVYLISDGLLTMGGLIASMMLASRSVQYVMQFSTILTRYQQAKSGIESVDQLLSAEPERAPNATIVERHFLEGDVRLEELSFVYPNSQTEVLKDLNISIKPGEKIALVGNMGSGKSTLLNLLSGLYLPTQGRLLFDNLDANHWDTDLLRQNIATVTQAPALIKGSIFENITLGLSKIDDRAVVEAIRECGLDNALARFEGGLDYVIGEGNRGVSGGQAQTISLARAIVKNASLMILDEPTSMLDKESEAKFLNYLARLDKSKTVVVSSHSPSILKLFDRAIVLDKGKVRFDGPTYKLFQGSSPGAKAGAKKDVA
ncbi:MAG: ATP-binding cassette domain-containing protein [Gammaproteobacteria bacterium]|nr:ATP-binding cassette domain-containing protein [Gammaproteobacteria bacterium]